MTVLNKLFDALCGPFVAERPVDQLYRKALQYLTGWRKCQIELDRVKRERALLVNFAKDVSKNYDHEEDAHRYDNGACRCCNADGVLEQVGETADGPYLPVPKEPTP